MSGFLAKALAIATLCCCPPESCAGFLSNWSAILTILATSSTLSDASFLSHLRFLANLLIIYLDFILGGILWI